MDNAGYGNKPFLDKKGSPGADKPCYAESPFFMEREIATIDDWDPVALNERRARLTEWALQRWNVPVEVAADVQGVPADQEDVVEADIEAEERGADAGRRACVSSGSMGAYGLRRLTRCRRGETGPRLRGQ